MVHKSATDGYAKADVYVAGRPGYPEGIEGWLVAKMGLDAKKIVLDLGAGTGKFIPLLQTSGAKIIAVEPVEGMRGTCQQNFPDISVLAGSATDVPLADQSVDAVICAQAFHWFASDKALAEIHRVLKPGGKLGLVWNVRDETVDWVAKLSQIIAPYETGTPRYHTQDWRKVFPSPLFNKLSETQFPHSHTGPASQVIGARIMSVSFIRSLPMPDQKSVGNAVQDLISSTPALVGQKAVSFPYVTSAFCCTRQI
ncbi:MAG: class I SAM-dependent methyltransferase [Paracoccaceae bacterium]